LDPQRDRSRAPRASITADRPVAERTQRGQSVRVTQALEVALDREAGRALQWQRGVGADEGGHGELSGTQHDGTGGWFVVGLPWR